jgi:TM2 domain-containing membrane protein YozV
MAKTVTDTNAADEPVVEIDLKDPRLAAFLAWLVPGLGHIYQGRTGKGVLFFVCIIGTFFYGMYIGNGRVVYASTANVFSMQFLQDRWQYVCQVGAGLPALPALVQRQRVREGMSPLFGDKFMRPPSPAPCESEDRTDRSHKVQHPDELAKWNYDLGDFFEIGTVFTVIAGLLNILAIYDAYGGPLIIIPDDKKKQLATAQ